MTNQKQQILEYIEKFGSITRMEAFLDLGIANPTARLSDLKKDGYSIKREDVPFTTRLNKKSRYSRWSLEEAHNDI